MLLLWSMDMCVMPTKTALDWLVEQCLEKDTEDTSSSSLFAGTPVRKSSKCRSTEWSTWSTFLLMVWYRAIWSWSVNDIKTASGFSSNYQINIPILYYSYCLSGGMILNIAQISQCQMSISETKEYPYEIPHEADKEILFIMSSNVSTTPTTTYYLNMTGSLCASDYFSCYADVNILTNFQVNKTSNAREHCSEQGKFDSMVSNSICFDHYVVNTLFKVHIAYCRSKCLT